MDDDNSELTPRKRKHERDDRARKVFFTRKSLPSTRASETFHFSIPSSATRLTSPPREGRYLSLPASSTVQTSWVLLQQGEGI